MPRGTLRATEVYWCEPSVTEARANPAQFVREPPTRQPAPRPAYVSIAYNPAVKSLLEKNPHARRSRLLCLLLASGLFATIARTQAPAAPAEPAETNRLVAGGGITVSGWQGKIDADSEKQGQTVSDAKLAPEGKGMRVTTGPPVTYWTPKNVAGGDYTVSATFTEPKFMNLNDHPHPYGIVIAGNDLGTAQQSLLYCAAYGNGTFIVRGFGPAAFQMGGRRPTANDAIHKAAGVGQPVSQDIAISVKGDSVTCSINGAVVVTYPKADLVAAGKLKSLDGVYGIRFAHNTDAVVTNLMMTKP